MQKVFLVLQACYFFISCSMESKLVADWWWTVWFDILFTFSRQLLNLHPCCRIRATKSVQRTITLYKYKLFNLFPFSVIDFCEVVMFKPWTQCVIEVRDSFFFLTTCVTSFRIMTPYFTMWVNKYSAIRTLSIWFLLDHNALRFLLHLAESVLKEIKSRKPTECDCSFVIFFFSDLV